MRVQSNKVVHVMLMAEKRAIFISNLKSLDNLSWKEGYDLIHSFCYSGIKLDLQQIIEVLAVENKDFIGLFLQEYVMFDGDDKAYLESFINESLNNSNTEFVSDLIYFAKDLVLNLDYLRILEIIRTHSEDENYIVLGCLNYVSNNIKLSYIEEIVTSLEVVINSSTYFHSEQILASLSLYRITHKSEYLDFITDLVEFEDANLEFLCNVLKEESYQSQFFNLNELKNSIPGIISLL